MKIAVAAVLTMSLTFAWVAQAQKPPQGWGQAPAPAQPAQPTQPTPPAVPPQQAAKPPAPTPPTPPQNQTPQPGQPPAPGGQAARPGESSPGQVPAPAPVGTPLAPGGSEQIRTVQILLRLVGIEPGGHDGVLSAATREAIRQFERQNGLAVTGEVNEQLIARLNQAAAVRTPGGRELQVAQTGTGFAVTRQGHVVTNHHVINNCQQLRVRPGTGGDPVTVQVLTQDQTADLAVLRLPAPVEHVATFRDGRSIRVGDAVVVIGFPLRGLLAAEAAVTSGEVSALAGLRNDARHMTVSAPVQPGNSGGPVFDRSGNLVGVIVSKLNAQQIARVTGDIPQNVNFAIKASVLRNLLEAAGVEYELASSTQALEPADIADRARRFTYVVECMR